MKPTYSICICNYNMADTIETALTSILDQLDDRFEVVIVDDGSSDASVQAVESMMLRYKNLRVIPLKRDPKRKLGLTRNISIQEAAGDYVILHLDCDDVYDPYLKNFVEVFHQIEKCMGHPILMNGQHIMMGQRDFLLQHGPYKNIFRGEDRNLWLRMAGIGAFIPLDHVNFMRRLPKTQKQRAFRSLFHTWDHMQNDFRGGTTLPQFLKYEKLRQDVSWKLKICRLGMMVPAYISAKFQEPLLWPDTIKTPEEFIAYRERTRGTFPQIMARKGCAPDWSVFSEQARKLFE